MMVKAGLTDGVTTTNNAGCSRGVAAQVALNGLKADLVEYPNGSTTTVSAGNATVVIGAGQAKKVQAAAGDKDGNYKNADGVTQFMERYQKDLKLGANDKDKFGRPDTNKWTYKGESVFTAKSTSNLVTSYTNKQTQKTLYELIDGKDATKKPLMVYQNGVLTTYAAVTNAIAKNNTSNFIDRNGVQMEVYYDSTATNAAVASSETGLVTIVAYDYFLVKASADYSASNKKVKVEWQSAKPAGSTTVANEIEQKDFDVENVKENDYLIVTVTDNTYRSVTPATKVTGNISAFTANSNITVDGTKYTKSGVMGKDGVAIGNAFADLKTGSDVTLVLDPNGFVLATTDETSANQYVYIYKVGSSANLDDDGKAIAYFVDGTRNTITYDSLTPVANTWYNYSVKSNGKYKLSSLSAVTSTDAKYTYSDTNKNLTGNAINYTDAVTGFGQGAGKANNATVFLTLKTNDLKANAKVYTGLKAPKTTGNATTIAAVVKDGKALYVFAIAGAYSGASTGDYVLLYGGNTTSTPKAFDAVTSGDDSYYEYGKTFLNGTQQTTQFANRGLQLVGTTAEMYYDLSYDSDGRVEGGTTVAGVASGAEFYHKTNVTKTAGISCADGVITVGNEAFKVADNAVVYVIDGTSIENPSLSGLKGTVDDTGAYHAFLVFTNDKDNIVKAAYFVK
jgi:hypothetical protein